MADAITSRQRVHALVAHLCAETPPSALRGNKVPITLTLHDREVLNYNSLRLRFALPSADQVLGLPPGQHVQFQVADASEKGGLLTRKYTPTSLDTDVVGFTDIVLKVYRPGHTHNGVDYEGGGKMTTLLEAMCVGETMQCTGPLGEVVYDGGGAFSVKVQNSTFQRKIKELGGPEAMAKDPTLRAQMQSLAKLHPPPPPVRPRANHVMLIVGGTGITPALQIARRIATAAHDDTRVTFINANQSEADIFCLKELDTLAELLGSQLQLIHALETRQSGSSSFPGHVHVGRVDGTLLKAHVRSGEATVALVCGPRGMVSSLASSFQKDLDFISLFTKHTQAVLSRDIALTF